MAHTAALHFPLDDATAEALMAALAPEAAEGPDGTATQLTRGADGIDIHIDAADLAGLRAAINSAVRLLDAGRRSIA